MSLVRTASLAIETPLEDTSKVAELSAERISSWAATSMARASVIFEHRALRDASFALRRVQHTIAWRGEYEYKYALKKR